MVDIEKVAREYAEGLSIPEDDLQFKTYRDQRRQADVTQIYFRTRNPNEKYGAEVIHYQGGVGPPQDIVKRQVHRTLRQMEETYLENGGRVTFYKNHSFFWRMPPAEGLKWSVEVECTVCGHTESVERSAADADLKRDLYLIALIKQCDEACDCDPDRWGRNDDGDYEHLGIDTQVEEGAHFPRVEAW